MAVNDIQPMDTLQKNLLQWTKLDIELKELNKALLCVSQKIVSISIYFA
tara:strand:- start:175 stop:321 length:147 start_codon:yes stop_codon:yes gene_type:complete